jgi:hypothetical protein
MGDGEFGGCGAVARGGRGVSAGAPAEIYGRATSSLVEAGVPFLVGGAYALRHYTPVARQTKDFDVFLRPVHVRWALAVLEGAGFRTALPFPHWLGKAIHGDTFVDVIFSSGNGVAVVDEGWFEHAVEADLLGRRLLLCPPEEMIWSKAFVFERERFDGADVLHLIRDQGERLDWDRLLRRFGRHWRVLFAHLVLYDYVFPSERARVPAWVGVLMQERLARDPDSSRRGENLCQGTLLSREQYLIDIERLGYRDARRHCLDVRMTLEDIARWTDAIPGREAHGGRDAGRDR